MQSPLRTIWFLFLVVVISGCSSNRFIQWQKSSLTQTQLQPISEQQLGFLNSLSQRSTAELSQICESDDSGDIVSLDRLVICHNAIDTYNSSVNTKIPESLIKNYNKALLQLLTNNSLTELEVHPNIEVQTDNDRLDQPFTEFYFAEQMQAKEPWLQPEIFPGVGVTVAHLFLIILCAKLQVIRLSIL